jgi:biopolymer transport protein ExbD
MQMKRGAVVLAMLALFCAASVFSQEKKLKKSDLPAAVQKTADEQSKGATVRGYGQETEGGKIAYEVQLIVNGHTKDVTIDPQGNVMEVEEEVDAKALPAEVREGLQKQAGKATIGKVESLTKHGTLVAYEAQVRQGKKRSEIQVGPDGKPLDHKE